MKAVSDGPEQRSESASVEMARRFVANMESVALADVFFVGISREGRNDYVFVSIHGKPGMWELVLDSVDGIVLESSGIE
jgi:hypothetical protein